ncbi:isoprenylcysteine carboxyl methyltransferase family protein [Neobacillus kokaensis]|uniref:Isoprenylcysteine carboxyl methyltransferase n=1 Tax=Neobacillus kokaensis TaxID=2759023 RepID=A0ABQ3N2M9_9BACI|nr:isoprenylcysteine carboxylmethyltransferase family protein [Neobacillus kokaensis]GHH98248.1 hypothetical protein AM1BK_17910 [Neobacillus kokaensis]
MIDFFPFICLISYLAAIRSMELGIAKSNENWMKQRGGVEFGASHYRVMVLMHMLFFVAFILEKIGLNQGLSPIWPVILFSFVLVQFLRVWVIVSLGRYWNTKIIVLPNAKVIMKGPYRFLRHPNYCVVSLELLVIPLLFSSYITAILFTLLNILMLRVRIPEEERALRSLTEYEGIFQEHNRFIPKYVK